MTYTSRFTNCPECGGSGYFYSPYSDAGLECLGCGGEGQWEDTCAECHEPKPLNDDGVCEECLALTETVSDPLRRTA